MNQVTYMTKVEQYGYIHIYIYIYIYIHISDNLCNNMSNHITGWGMGFWDGGNGWGYGKVGEGEGTGWGMGMEGWREREFYIHEQHATCLSINNFGAF